jgi:hypothetical protein
VFLNTARVSPLLNYIFSPIVSKGRSPAFAWWEEAFTDEEIEQMKKQLKALVLVPASINDEDGPAPEQIRSSKVS